MNWVAARIDSIHPIARGFIAGVPLVAAVVVLLQQFAIALVSGLATLVAMLVVGTLAAVTVFVVMRRQ